MDELVEGASTLTTPQAPPPNVEKKQKNPAAPIIPLLEEEELADLAKQFAEQIPEGEMSVRINFSSLSRPSGVRGPG